MKENPLNLDQWRKRCPAACLPTCPTILSLNKTPDSHVHIFFLFPPPFISSAHHTGSTNSEGQQARKKIQNTRTHPGGVPDAWCVVSHRQGPGAPAPTWNKASCLQHVGMAVSDRCQHGANRCWLFQTGANTLSSLSPSASLSPSKPKCHLTFYSDNRAFQCVSATYVQKSLWTQRRVKEPGKISINKIPQWSSPELKRGYHI